MKHMFSWAVCLLAVVVFGGIGYNLAVQAAGVTPVCGVLSANSTWILANSPYEVCSGGMTIPAGVTLNIEPGVIVQFQSNALLTLRGTLAASGTPDSPVIFTSAIAPPGSWAGILADGTLLAPAQINLSYATFQRGGLNSLLGAQVIADHAAVKISHGLFQDGPGNGILASSNTVLDIRDTQFTANGGNAVRLIQPTSDLMLSGLSASGNGLNAIFIGGTTYLHGQRHLPSPGLPYVVDGVIGNNAGDSLTIDPGSELQFTANGWLNIAGGLIATGLPTSPILLTGQTKVPGSWNGLAVFGTQIPANARLDYVTVEYAGRNVDGANITVNAGYLVAHHSIIRFSQRDGVRFNANGTGSVLESQIVGNPLYGVRNLHPTLSVLASNDWWGSPAGPVSDLTSCSQGAGDKVTAGVIFRPVLPDAAAAPPIPLSDAPILTMTPRRWFAPADGTSKVYFDITLRDGNGTLLPGRTVRLSSSSGVVTDGGITDVNGKTLAFLVSNTAGDAEVTAALDSANTCEGALSPTSKITFTTPVNVTNLFPDAPASYFDGKISVSPLPVIVGVPATIHATIKNPLTVPITVDVSFGFAQSGIGLAFGPIQDLLGQVILPGESRTLSASWVPVVSGHYCVQVSYTITAIGTAQVNTAQQGSSGTQQFNVSSVFGSVASFLHKTWIDNMDNVYQGFREYVPKDAAVGVKYSVIILWKSATAAIMPKGQTWSDDPPRQDYKLISTPRTFTYPIIQPDLTTTAARAAAMNAISADLVDIFANAEAVVIAMDRYGGASEAQDLAWAAQQANVRIYYEQQMGTALLKYADDLDTFKQVLINEGENVVISASDVIAYQQQLAAQGFSAEEIATSKQFGMTDADIEAYRQLLISADPYQVAGNVLDRYTEKAAVSRATGQALLTPYVYAPSHTVSGSAGLQAGLMAVTPTGNTLAQVNNTVTTIQLANPLDHTAVIDLNTRRIDLPADWAVSVSPAQINLGPGEQTTLTVSVFSGSPIPQGSIPRLAVEGYAGSQLLGGVVVAIVVPDYMPFDGTLRFYLPMIDR